MKPPPTVEPQLDYLYEWYNGFTTVMLILGVVLLSRWVFWTMKLKDFESNAINGSTGNATVTVFLAVVMWSLEYAAVGGIARWSAPAKWPSPIPVLPSWTAMLAFAVSFLVIAVLDCFNLAPEAVPEPQAR